MEKEDIIAGFIPILKELRSIKRALDTAPTFTPQNSVEQIQYYESGATKRLYIYIAGTWRYVALT